MKRAENLNAPSLSGWMLAAGAGILAFTVSKAVGGFDYTTSGFFGTVVLVGSGLVMGMPWGAKSRIPTADLTQSANGASAPARAKKKPN